ncbi:MAG: hypothetical protein K2Y21_03620 [Phycisphaerales bacterium]|nr:hypothetical protein [Phycisphaerales bacterium]
MSDPIARLLIAALGLYAAVGGVVAAWFLVRGSRRMDAGVRTASVWFKLLIAPGLAALWPWVVARAGSKATQDDSHDA